MTIRCCFPIQGKQILRPICRPKKTIHQLYVSTQQTINLETYLIVQTVEKIVAQQTIDQHSLSLKIFSESACSKTAMQEAIDNNNEW